jgi:hypothetical protein
MLSFNFDISTEQRQKTAEEIYFLLISNYSKLRVTSLPESASELYRPSERRLSGKLVPTFGKERGCRVVSVTDPYGRILGFLDRSRYLFIQVALEL